MISLSWTTMEILRLPCSNVIGMRLGRMLMARHMCILTKSAIRKSLLYWHVKCTNASMCKMHLIKINIM
ncbi:hypothetical protein AHAS_Ahas15G0216700 [Arachis hypogaea]